MSVMQPPPNPLIAANVPDWMWWRYGREERIKSVTVGHAMSESTEPEFATKTPDEIARATATVDAYDSLFALPAFVGEVPRYVGPQAPGAPNADTITHPAFVWPWAFPGQSGPYFPPPAPPQLQVQAGPAFCPNCGTRLR